jgi:hypothetical protein
MKLYTWQLTAWGLHRFIMVAAHSVQEARLMTVHHGLADIAEVPEDWRPGGCDFEAVMKAPDFETEMLGPPILDSYH